MQKLTLIAALVFISTVVLVQAEIINFKKTPPVISPTPEASVEASPSASITASASPNPLSSPHKNTPKPTPKASANAQINIKVDAVKGMSTEKLIYPGAHAVNANTYETNDAPDVVYTWYKSEFDKRQFQIRNNVKTQANEVFKAVLQGVSGNTSLKVTIERNKEGAPVTITLE